MRSVDVLVSKVFIDNIRVLMGRGFLIDCSVLIALAIFLKMLFTSPCNCRILIKDNS